MSSGFFLILSKTILVIRGQWMPLVSGGILFGKDKRRKKEWQKDGERREEKGDDGWDGRKKRKRKGEFVGKGKQP